MTVTTCYPDDTDWGTFNWEQATQEQKNLRDLAEEFAWMYLDRITGHALALCPTRVRPAKWSCRAGAYYLAPAGAATGPFNPYVGADGQYRNEAHRWGCECDDTRIINLPTVVGGIEYIQIGEDTLPATAYRVDDGNRLVRQDGQGWPLRQDMWALAGEEDTFTVSYYAGIMPTRLHKFAAGVLAREFLKSQTGDKGCRLPTGTTSVVRQGTSVTIDPLLAAGMRTGIPEVDQVVMSINPYGLKNKSRVYSPDTMSRTPITTVGSRDTAVVPGVPGPSGGGLVADPNNPGYYILQGA